MLLLLWLCSDAQLQQGFSANGAPEPPSLTRTTLNVFDQDKDGSVTLKEVRHQLHTPLLATHVAHEMLLHKPRVVANP